MKPQFFISLFDTTDHKFTLSNLIRESIDIELADVNKKIQLDAIASTLVDLGTKIMVCEINYVDRGFADDYLNYYVGCHTPTPKTCSRIHFFTGDSDYQNFSYEDFEKIVAGETDDSKLGEYQGFMVIKPIPMTFIGRTCLRVPPKLNDANLITREYSANLFGMKQSFQSLAFQEQDRVTAACTSASIWCLLHGLGRKQVPSPARITLAATETSKKINSFPCVGLNFTEIERALESFELKLWHVASNSDNRVNQELITLYVKAYIDSSIPLILGGQWSSLNANGEYEVKGDHAITIVGYQDNQNGEIESLIVLDDRRGPYTVLYFDNAFPSRNIDKTAAKLSTQTVLVTEDQRNPEAGTKYKDFMTCNALIIATDPKVRVGFKPIRQTARMLANMGF